MIFNSLNSNEPIYSVRKSELLELLYRSHKLKCLEEMNGKETYDEKNIDFAPEYISSWLECDPEDVFKNQYSFLDCAKVSLEYYNEIK